MTFHPEQGIQADLPRYFQKVERQLQNLKNNPTEMGACERLMELVWGDFAAFSWFIRKHLLIGRDPGYINPTRIDTGSGYYDITEAVGVSESYRVLGEQVAITPRHIEAFIIRRAVESRAVTNLPKPAFLTPKEAQQIAQLKDHQRILDNVFSMKAVQSKAATR